MRHRMNGRQFGRNSSHRKALFRNLVTSFIEHEKIKTTEAKAKEIRGIAEKMITLGKKGDLHAKRMAMSYIRSRDVVAKLFDDVAARVANRDGGYTRIVKTRVRFGDSAPMAVLELVDKPGEVYKGPSKKKAAPKAKAKAKTTKKKEEAKPVVEEAAETAAAETPVVETPAAETEASPVAEAAEETKADAQVEEAAAPETSMETPNEEEEGKKE
jgi:large subunit ribosomal protein L17